MSSAWLQRMEKACFGIQWVLVGCVLWLVLDSAFFLSELPQPQLVGGEAVSLEEPPSDEEATLSQFQSIWTRDLRQQLIKPKLKAKPKPKPPPPPPPVKLPKLVATFVEEGQAWGLFVDNRGAQRVLAATGKIDDFQIARVAPGTAKLTRHGKSYTVNVDKRKGERMARRKHRSGK